MTPNNVNHFASTATGLSRKRSTFKRPSDLKTTFNAGVLIPNYIDEVLPGDTFDMNESMVVRSMTPLNPVMDNAFIDQFFFFVPARFLWTHWKEFMGENNTDYWTQKTAYTVPQVKYTQRTPSVNVGTVADYMGLPPVPTGYAAVGESVNVLPFRAYVKIWNDWFRDENTQNPAHMYTDETTRTVNYPLSGSATYVDSAELGGKLCPVNKFKDYFTSCLPSPQKGEAITIFDGTSTALPVNNGGSLFFQPNVYDNSGARIVNYTLGTDSSGSLSTKAATSGANAVANLRLTADASALSPTVNQLRLAFQQQKFLETQARGGSRYIEVILSQFGVRASDYRQGRSEYLGGKRIPISMSQIPQTGSQQDPESSPLGHLGAFSQTNSGGHMFTKSFEEHGYIIGVCCVRTSQTYSQGVERLWSRKNLEDFYFPVYANLGEQPVYRKEIYYTSSPTQDNTVFGYQEHWAEYRYKPSRTSGYMRPTAPQSLASWHYGVNFGSAPVLNSAFIVQGTEEIDRTLVDDSSIVHQFFGDFFFDLKTTRIMPMYSVPGLIDHH